MYIGPNLTLIPHTHTHVLLQIVRRLRFNLSHYEFLVSALVKGSFSPPLWETTTLHRSFSLSLKCFRTCSVEYVTYARDPSNFACLLRGVVSPEIIRKFGLYNIFRLICLVIG